MKLVAKTLTYITFNATMVLKSTDFVDDFGLLTTPENAGGASLLGTAVVQARGIWLIATTTE
jgi:hypothetical protein